MNESDPEQTSEPPEISSWLLNEALDLLGVEGEGPRSATGKRLKEEAEKLGLDRWIEPLYGKPREQRLALRRLHKSLVQVLVDMCAIAPEYAVALDWLVDVEQRPPEGVLPRARTSVLSLADAIEGFDQAYQPPKGRAADVFLEEAVRSLAEVVTSITGRVPTVQLNKHNDKPPSLSSNEAKVIGMLLQAVDPQLREPTVAHMIVKVRNQRWPTESHLAALGRITLEAEISLSLLPKRRGSK